MSGVVISSDATEQVPCKGEGVTLSEGRMRKNRTFGLMGRETKSEHMWERGCGVSPTRKSARGGRGFENWKGYYR